MKNINMQQLTEAINFFDASSEGNKYFETYIGNTLRNVYDNNSVARKERELELIKPVSLLNETEILDIVADFSTKDIIDALSEFQAREIIYKLDIILSGEVVNRLVNSQDVRQLEELLGVDFPNYGTPGAFNSHDLTNNNGELFIALLSDRLRGEPMNLNLVKQTFDRLASAGLREPIVNNLSLNSKKRLLSSLDSGRRVDEHTYKSLKSLSPIDFFSELEGSSKNKTTAAQGKEKVLDRIKPISLLKEPEISQAFDKMSIDELINNLSEDKTKEVIDNIEKILSGKISEKFINSLSIEQLESIVGGIEEYNVDKPNSIQTRDIVEDDGLFFTSGFKDMARLLPHTVKNSLHTIASALEPEQREQFRREIADRFSLKEKSELLESQTKVGKVDLETYKSLQDLRPKDFFKVLSLVRELQAAPELYVNFLQKTLQDQEVVKQLNENDPTKLREAIELSNEIDYNIQAIQGLFSNLGSLDIKQATKLFDSLDANECIYRYNIGGYGAAKDAFSTSSALEPLQEKMKKSVAKAQNEMIENSTKYLKFVENTLESMRNSYLPLLKSELILNDMTSGFRKLKGRASNDSIVELATKVLAKHTSMPEGELKASVAELLSIIEQDPTQEQSNIFSKAASNQELNKVVRVTAAIIDAVYNYFNKGYSNRHQYMQAEKLTEHLIKEENLSRRNSINQMNDQNLSSLLAQEPTKELLSATQNDMEEAIKKQEHQEVQSEHINIELNNDQVKQSQQSKGNNSQDRTEESKVSSQVNYFEQRAEGKEAATKASTKAGEAEAIEGNVQGKVRHYEAMLQANKGDSAKKEPKKSLKEIIEKHRQQKQQGKGVQGRGPNREGSGRGLYGTILDLREEKKQGKNKSKGDSVLEKKELPKDGSNTKSRGRS